MEQDLGVHEKINTFIFAAKILLHNSLYNRESTHDVMILLSGMTYSAKLSLVFPA